MPMKRLAIDIVILPPDPIIKLALDTNRMLLSHIPEGIILGKDRNMPHISLLMGCIVDSLLSEVTLRLRAISKKTQALHLSITGIHSHNSGSHNVISFDIERSNELLALHQLLVNEFKPLLTHDAEEGDFNDAPPIAASSISWVNRFIPDACFDNFWPHITLGFGNYTGTVDPVPFTASRLAICHLGNHCTCSRIIEEVSLASQ